MTQAPVPARRPALLTGLFWSFLLAGPTTGVLPLVRRLRGRTGVQTGPYLVTLPNAAVYVLVRRLQHSDRVGERQRTAAGSLMVAWQVVSPVLASAGRRTVVLPGRSPLWGYLVNALCGMALDVLVHRRTRRRRPATPPATP